MTATLTNDLPPGTPFHGVLFSGTGHPALASTVAATLGTELGVCRVARFPDGEVDVELEESIRGKDVFLLQPTAPPVNEHLVELLVLADACRRADARRIVAVVPYFGYARSDKREARRVPVTARAVADLMQSVGIDHVITMDVHTPQLEGFFRIPIDDLSAINVLCDAIRRHVPDDAVIVAPDLGAAHRATLYSGKLERSTAICVKRRISGEQVETRQVIGDVRDRTCVLVDDMISTAGTIVEAVKVLVAHGAHHDVIVVASHGVLSTGALTRMREAGVRELYLTDSLPLPPSDQPPIRCVSVAPVLANAIWRIASGESLRELRPSASSR